MLAADAIALDEYEAWIERVSGMSPPSHAERLLAAGSGILDALEGLPRTELAGEIARAEITAGCSSERPWIERMRRRILRLVGLDELGKARAAAREALAMLRALLARAVAPAPGAVRPVDRAQAAAIPVHGLLVVATVAHSTAPPAFAAG